MSRMPVRRALPTLFLSNEEYEVLEGMATQREITVADLLKELIESVVDVQGRLVVLDIPKYVYEAFAEFYDDETPENAIARYIGTEGDVLGRALAEARGD